MPKTTDVVKQLAEAAVHRITNTGVKGKIAEKVARNMFMGASTLALIQEDAPLGRELHTCFTDIVEQGLKQVYKWAGVAMPEGEHAETREAA